MKLKFEGSYDVNVSPDKRTILLHDQNALLELLKVPTSRAWPLNNTLANDSRLRSSSSSNLKTRLSHNLK